MNDQPTPEEIRGIGDALASGNKIAAIKLYREATGKDLKEAKDFVEALLVQLQEQDPEKYAVRTGGYAVRTGGCVPVLLVCLGLLAGVVGWILSG